MNSEATELVYDGKSIEAKKNKEDWVFCYWKTNKLGHIPLSFAKDYRRIEKIIEENNYRGWYCNSENDHKEMHKIIKEMGAEEIFNDDKLTWFSKEMIFYV